MYLAYTDIDHRESVPDGVVLAGQEGRVEVVDDDEAPAYAGLFDRVQRGDTAICMENQYFNHHQS